MPKVSIIAPMYNVEKYLDQCISSFMEQTLTDIEIIMVDDGSPDKSGTIADKYARKDSRIKVFHKKNCGVSAARNDGLKMATGDYVIFCDSDDWMDPRACEILYSAAVENKADISIGDVYMSYTDRNDPVRFYKENFVTNEKKMIQDLIKADIHRTYCENPPEIGAAFGYGGPWNKLVRRSLITDNDIHFDVRTKGVFDDILYTAHILANAECVCYTSYPLYFYRQVEDSITNSYKANAVEISEAIFNSWEEFFEKYDRSGEFREAYYACIIRRIVEMLKFYYVNAKNPKSKKDLKAEYLKMIHSEPYSTAIKCVNRSKLNKKQKAVVMLSKNSLLPVLWVAFKKTAK